MSYTVEWTVILTLTLRQILYIIQNNVYGSWHLLPHICLSITFIFLQFSRLEKWTWKILQHWLVIPCFTGINYQVIILYKIHTIPCSLSHTLFILSLGILSKISKHKKGAGQKHCQTEFGARSGVSLVRHTSIKGMAKVINNDKLCYAYISNFHQILCS